MTTWEAKPLGEVCEINPKLVNNARPSLETEVSFVPMAAVDEVFGEIVDPPIRTYQEVERGYTPFRAGDVLFAKITPCMENGKTAIVPDLVNGLGFGSTEFHVLRPGSEVISAWVHYFIRQSSFRARAEANFTGSAGQRRVPSDFLKRVDIPVPPLDEQERIVKLLDEADALRKLRAEADRRMGELVPALFYEMFGDPVENPMGWPIATLGEVGLLDRGRSAHRPRNAPELYGGPYPFVQTGDVVASDGLITEFRQTYSEEGLGQSKLWPTGTLAITIAANIGKTGILTFPACFPDSIVGFTAGPRVSAIYVREWFETYQAELEAKAPQMAQRNINLRILGNLRLPIPPRALQDTFAVRAHSLASLSSTGSISRDGLNRALSSLLDSLFRSKSKAT